MVEKIRQGNGGARAGHDDQGKECPTWPEGGLGVGHEQVQARPTADQQDQGRNQEWSKRFDDVHGLNYTLTNPHNLVMILYGLNELSCSRICNNCKETC